MICLFRSRTQLLTLYMLDSHAYTTKRLPGIWGWFQKLKYDWIKQSQIDWFLAESGKILPIFFWWRNINDLLFQLPSNQSSGLSRRMVAKIWGKYGSDKNLQKLLQTTR